MRLPFLILNSGDICRVGHTVLQKRVAGMKLRRIANGVSLCSRVGKGHVEFARPEIQCISLSLLLQGSQHSFIMDSMSRTGAVVFAFVALMAVAQGTSIGDLGCPAHIQREICVCGVLGK
jgi:hypothetical protein